MPETEEAEYREPTKVRDLWVELARKDAEIRRLQGRLTLYEAEAEFREAAQIDEYLRQFYEGDDQ